MSRVIDQYRLDQYGNEICPHNPWPIGCDWWYRTNEVYTEAKSRREYMRGRWHRETVTVEGES